MHKTSKNKVFDIIKGVDALSEEVSPTEWIIETLLPENFQTILAGTTGSNKSIYAMQEGMSIANDEKEFLGFRIHKKGLNVLYADTEVGRTELIRRYQRIARSFTNWSGEDRFNMLSKSGSFADIWDELYYHVKCFEPDVLYIDCLYNSSSEKDISKNQNIAKFTDRITDLKAKFGLTIRIIHHFNKGGSEFGLNMDRMSGASALQNWVEHLILMDRTNLHSIRLLKIVKARGVDFPNDYYGIQWNIDEFKLSMIGVVKNWKRFIIDEHKKKSWQQALNKIAEEFSTKDWVTLVSDELCLVKERQAKEWLREIELVKMIEKAKHGTWRKTKLKFVEDIYESE